MANLPIRRLGDIGIITDISPFDLPPNALSQGSNIRCANGRVKRAPVFRTITNTTANAASANTPVFTWTYAAPGEDDKIGIAYIDGTLSFYNSAGEVDVTPSSFTPANSSSPVTATTLANVNYLNRETAVPMYYGPESTEFDELPNWDSTWRCRSLRPFRDQLVAINITRGANTYPTMVKTSDITTVNSYPGSWDESDPGNSAYENTLSDCHHELIDGLTLRDVFILYSEDQCWLMEYTGDADIFRIRKLFDNVGVLNVNCIVEVEGRHYIFGKNDIYMHDGVAVESIITDRNKRYVYDNMLLSQVSKFFVLYNPHIREIMFCYASGDGECAFVGTDYCNKAAAYNIDNGSWTFRDLPNVGVGTFAALSQSVTYASATEMYSTAGGSFSSYEASAEKTLFFPSPSSIPGALTQSRLYGYDEAYGGHLTQSISTEATKKAWVERVGIDLDETGESVNTYKVVRRIFPQASGLGETGNFHFKFAGTLYAGETADYGSLQSFDPSTQYKIDVNVGGRYLAWYWENSSQASSELSGFDLDVVVTGRK